jgi:hypothetical protein
MGEVKGYRTHDPAAQASSPTYQYGLMDGQSDARRLAEGLQPAGMDDDLAAGYMYRQGYADGLNEKLRGGDGNGTVQR